MLCSFIEAPAFVKLTFNTKNTKRSHILLLLFVYRGGRIMGRSLDILYAVARQTLSVLTNQKHSLFKALASVIGSWTPVFKG